MTVERSSTNLVRFLGASVKATQNQGKLVNTVSNGQGGESTRRSASVGRLANRGQGAASINIADYQAALGYLELRGVPHLAAKAMAAVLVDSAKSQGIGVMKLLETSSQRVSLSDNNVFNRINQLRDGTSQLSNSRPIDNSKSTKSRFIKP